MDNKIKDINKSFMKETLLDLWDYYEQSLLNIECKTWDWIVLTASNEEQAQIYNSEIEYRRKQNLVPKNINFLVLPDPDGKRVGSGGATLNVLKEISKQDKRSFSELKILTIHSGGDSKRIPQYSVCGKLFSPVQRQLPNGRSSSLFDEFLITFSSVANRMKSGMLLLSGDVMLTFNPLQVELFHLDSAAISIKEDVETGKNHGVFLTNSKGELLEFLHKMPVKELKEKGAVNNSNKVDIDTGAIYLSSDICEELFTLISENNILSQEKFDKYVNDYVRLSLYGDFLYPLAQNGTYDEYLLQSAEGVLNDELREIRKILWKKLSKYQMRIIKTSPSEFIHFGTTTELKDLVTKKISDYDYLGWERNILTNNIRTKVFSSNCAYVSQTSIVGKNCYIEKSFVGENCTIGDNVILSNVSIASVDIPSNVCLNTLKQTDGTFVTRIYSTDENPKAIKSPNAQFLSHNLIDVLEYYNIKDNLLWSGGEQSLWEAKLYQKCQCEEDSIRSALELYNLFNKNLSIKQAQNYFKKERISLKYSFNNCDAEYVREQAEQLEIHVRALNYFDMLCKKTNLDEANVILLKSPNLLEQINKILELIPNQQYQVKYRAFLGLSLIFKDYPLENFDYKYYEDLCYKEIKNAIGVSELEELKKISIKDEVVSELPIRVNFAGGWSDTPPFCIENGGSVLNGAFKLNGIKPIKVIIKKNASKIILSSIDLSAKKEFTDVEDLKDCYNTNDPFSLFKASLLITGIVKLTDKSVEDIINRIGSGFEFTTDVTSIPKGSGLGTSSILSATCLKALYQFLGIDANNEQIARKTLEQEQLMGTGGGWQDQIGGLYPGIKLVTSKKGPIQQFNVKPINLSTDMEKMFNNQFVLIYTGQRRLAKNLLRNIMNGYIKSDEIIVKSIKKIKNISGKMAAAIENSNREEFAKLLNAHWEISKTLDKGCTNCCIDQIINACNDLIEAKMICGAGGGGFLQILLKNGVTKEDLKNRINEVFQDSGVSVYEISLVKE